MAKKSFGAKSRRIDLSGYLNWPRRVPKDEWWQALAAKVRAYPAGDRQSWGIPFKMGEGAGPRVIIAAAGKPEVCVPLGARADFVCLLHSWSQLPSTLRGEDPTEGLVVGEYELRYADGTRHVQPVRGRFEVPMVESPGPVWLAMGFNMDSAVDPVQPPPDFRWGRAQTGLRGGGGDPLIYALPNPCPDKQIESLTIRGLRESPLMVAGITLFSGAAHPLSHLPRRTYRVSTGREPVKIADVKLDMGAVARIQRTTGPRGKAWLDAPHIGLTMILDPENGPEELIEAVGAPDATVSVTIEGKKKPEKFSLGETFTAGKSVSGSASLEVLGKKRQWMRVRVIDSSTGKPTPVRLHLSGSRGEYIAPYGHHEQINASWFEDYGADVLVSGRNYAYVGGEFATDMPVGDVYVEMYKGFEYQPVRSKVTVKPGQDVLDLEISRWKDLRSKGWVTADTHVHFISPHTAWLEGQCEGVNVINLLASQWGRLFTNVGDITGRVGICEDDTIVYVGTENRNHMLGHISMLGTKGLPVYPMCDGGPGESWVGDPDFMSLAEWARENKRKGGVVVRPHYPYCGHTEDPVPILKGLIDALEIQMHRGGGFPVQEWYRYLNCGYRVAVCGGTDKMGAYTALGWLRTYALLDTNKPFTYDQWADAVRAGRTISTNGPLIDLAVEGKRIGDTIKLPKGGGTMEIDATAESIWPMGKLEVVHNGCVVAADEAPNGSRVLHTKKKVKIRGSGWIAARCYGYEGHPGSYTAAHTSPVYIACGDSRAFDGPAAEHMLALVEGGIEYLNTIATAYDEPSRKRMVKLFREAQAELKGRLIVEGGHRHHHGAGPYHTHGHGAEAGHKH